MVKRNSEYDFVKDCKLWEAKHKNKIYLNKVKLPKWLSHEKKKRKFFGGSK